MNVNITPEVIEALQNLRELAVHGAIDGPLGICVRQSVNTLDNAGIFSAIDEATGYDIDPEPVRVSKCTCPATVPQVAAGNHFPNCPGDPAEWGDMAFRYTPAVQASTCNCPLHLTANTHYTNCENQGL